MATTSELSLNFLRVGFPGSGTLVARARLVDAGTQLGLAAAEVTDQSGRLLAYATTRCVITPVQVEGERGQQPVTPGWSPDGTPDPWQRPHRGGWVEGVDRLPGVEAAAKWVTGEWVEPPCAALLGTWPVSVSEGEARFRARPSGWWTAGSPSLYGGALAWLAEMAQAAAFQSVLPAGTIYANLDLKVQFLRPVFPGTELVADGRVVHKGRRVLVATVEVRDAAGKLCLLATGSAAVIPGGIEWLRNQRRS